jgi:hypothetical protein
MESLIRRANSCFYRREFGKGKFGREEFGKGVIGWNR